MAVKDHILQPTATVSGISGPTVAASTARFSGIKEMYSNLTISIRDVFQLPQRFVVGLDHLLGAPWQLLDTAGTTRVAGGDAMTGAAQAAARQPTADAVGWRRVLGDAFQLSNNGSYWGLLHYITSRWASTTFALVRLAELEHWRTQTKRGFAELHGHVC